VPSPRPGWAFLPALGGALAHAPVLRYDLLPELARPLDAGATLRGHRILGDNKTVRGALVMSGGTLAGTLLLSRTATFRSKLPAELQARSPAAYGALLGASVVLGELPNSFLKRQLGIPPGRRGSSPLGVALALLDQGDFVLFSRLMLAPLWRMSARELGEAFAVVCAVHSAVNAVGYALGARDSPL
jgi:CDP-2,3-bis-(O-geranylgeranyl)-sn-glycerol synthase